MRFVIVVKRHNWGEGGVKQLKNEKKREQHNLKYYLQRFSFVKLILDFKCFFAINFVKFFASSNIGMSTNKIFSNILGINSLKKKVIVHYYNQQLQCEVLQRFGWLNGFSL